MIKQEKEEMEEGEVFFFYHSHQLKSEVYLHA